ncbi:hypothetical protein [Methylotuvimicrobium alcaliphilum]|uniref:Uncharacterized protein n=1 Tax=Methylotuvimicrobium alcaliphilum (strain DSM 19304 / NCIMB 14124 / VKM B-2133 / 20Z) TaxID=1091494 RepID=G4T3X9_META2|nr:hypothetical protein [Methylotuvimicrobium alcaliphilum]CCE22678.1 protein of unknown function [Methylotuvimicrobium alcaliphilum 20Z]
MALAEQDVEQIEAIVQRVLTERMESKSGMVRYDLELRERFVRVEEELKHQRELMLEGFKQMEKRFEQVDKRFELQHQEIMALHQEIKVLMRWGFVGLGWVDCGSVQVGGLVC